MIWEDLLTQEVLRPALVLQCPVLADIQTFSVLEAIQDYFFYNVTDIKISDFIFSS